jgi:hypothetical protein
LASQLRASCLTHQKKSQPNILLGWLRSFTNPLIADHWLRILATQWGKQIKRDSLRIGIAMIPDL